MFDDPPGADRPPRDAGDRRLHRGRQAERRRGRGAGRDQGLTSRPARPSDVAASFSRNVDDRRVVPAAPSRPRRRRPGRRGRSGRWPGCPRSGRRRAASVARRTVIGQSLPREEPPDASRPTRRSRRRRTRRPSLEPGFAGEPGDRGHLRDAGAAPGRPDVEEDGFPWNCENSTGLPSRSSERPVVVGRRRRAGRAGRAAAARRPRPEDVR